uniref:Uncharacterized protein n=1 Tax=Glossina pallidipes TaxID=7398 RepID=A0A1A9ZFN8_GLOPL
MNETTCNVWLLVYRKNRACISLSSTDLSPPNPYLMDHFETMSPDPVDWPQCAAFSLLQARPCVHLNFHSTIYKTIEKIDEKCLMLVLSRTCDRAKPKSYREILTTINALTNISLNEQCPNIKFSYICVWYVNEYHRRHHPYQAHTHTTQYFIYNYYKNGNCVIETVIVMRSNERKNISVTKSAKNVYFNS